MKKPQSYNEFLQIAQTQDVEEIAETLSKGAKSLDIYLNYFRHFNVLQPATYVLDYSQKAYIHTNDKMSGITGYPNSYMIDGGLEFGLKLWHKEDLEVFSRKIILDNIGFIQSVPPEKHGDYIFSCNYRVRTKKGEYRNLLQQSVYLKSSASGLPLVTMGFLTDITEVRNDTKIIHMIECVNSADRKKGSEIVFKKTHFSKEKDAVLTVRELEIVKWICEGLSSRQIAEKLHRSVNTVNNHRRSILEKTGCRNVVDLIRYAISNKYL
jgi:DNA-binding CsgD family transcriptional regulator